MKGTKGTTGNNLQNIIIPRRALAPPHLLSNPVKVFTLSQSASPRFLFCSRSPVLYVFRDVQELYRVNQKSYLASGSFYTHPAQGILAWRRVASHRT